MTRAAGSQSDQPQETSRASDRSSTSTPAQTADPHLQQDQPVAGRAVVGIDGSLNMHTGLDGSDRQRGLNDQVDDESTPVRHDRRRLPTKLGCPVEVASQQCIQRCAFVGEKGAGHALVLPHRRTSHAAFRAVLPMSGQVSDEAVPSLRDLRVRSHLGAGRTWICRPRVRAGRVSAARVPARDTGAAHRIAALSDGSTGPGRTVRGRARNPRRGRDARRAFSDRFGTARWRRSMYSSASFAMAGPIGARDAALSMRCGSPQLRKDRWPCIGQSQ